MPLVLVDLDETLIDRASAFRDWAAGFLTGQGLPVGELSWMEALDAEGTLCRQDLFTEVCTRYHLTEPVEELVMQYRREFPRMARSFPGVAEALSKLAEHGCQVVVVTNGGQTQLDKLAAAGLDELTDRCCASEIVGSQKPDADIFRLAARRCGLDLADGWMVGDNPEKDIRGADRVGLRTAWIHRGRQWPAELPAPTVVVDSFADAVDHILGP